MESSSTPTLMALIDSSPYWSSFLGDLAAGSVLLVLASFLLPRYLEWRHRPKMKFFGTYSRRRPFHWTQSEDGQWETTLNLSIRSYGKKTIDRFYWEMYVEKDLNLETPPVVSKTDGYPIERREGGKFIRLYGYITMPLFSMDEIEFPYAIKLKIKTQRPVKIYYYFRTDWGTRPFWAWIGAWHEWYFLLPSLDINKGPSLKHVDETRVPRIF